MKKNNFCIGLMSGTSLDGIDCALVDIQDNHIDLVGTCYLPYSLGLRHALELAIKDYPNDKSTLNRLDTILGKLYVKSIQKLCQQNQLSVDDIQVIGCHGQTIAHQPQASKPFTLQIGDAHLIHSTFGIPVVHDFRSDDMAKGGQGAPLAPLFHAWYFKDFIPCAVVNIGGISNITLLQPNKPLIGWDIGPGNTLMDYWCHKHTGKTMDHKGEYAKQGTVNTVLLETLLDEPYFKQAPPKSTGTDYFNAQWLERQLTTLPAQDIQATLTHLTAQSITNTLEHSLQTGNVFICGGGVHNQYLMDAIRVSAGNRFKIQSTEQAGLSPDWVEAVCFAWLAKMRLENSPFATMSLTGSSEPVFIGSISNQVS